jgi:hypothetical protein
MKEPTGTLEVDKPPNNDNLFIPGLELSEIYYKEAIQPILQSDFPHLNYAAGLIGSGSEVLGFDTPQSMDHHWGPRAQIFVSAQDQAQYSAAITETLRNKLPYDIRGISTNYGKPDNIGVRLLEKIDKGPVNHLVAIHTLRFAHF